MDTIENYQHKGFNIEIHYSDSENPREWEEASTFVMFNRNYDFGDKHSFNDAEALQDYLKENEDKLYILPVYMYEHGGVTIKTSPFSCGWDSGQIGYIYMTKEKAIEEGLSEETAYKRMNQEIKTLDDWIRGECFGYEITDAEGWHIDACGGFLGDIDYCKKEAESVADYYDNKLPKQYEFNFA